MQVVIANSKGGSGKTMLATQIAGYYACAGRRVAILDHDSQQSSIDWVKARPKQCAAVIPVAAYAGGSLGGRADVLIHDMPAGYDIGDIFTDISGIDKLLIPVVPSPTDMRAAIRYFMTLSRSGILDSHVSIGLVSNRSRNAIAYSKVMNEFLFRLGIPVVGIIRDTQNYIHAIKRGLSIFDLPSNRTVDDRENWDPIIKWLELAPDPVFCEQVLSDVSMSEYEVA
ncbi:MAG: division plane positioning ATPase MipZ [Pseudomonadales bacterium]